MAFSLSPAVIVKEWDISSTITNLPSSIAGAVIRAEKGPCLVPVSISNEAELVDIFGKPNETNYNEWYQCWNFLQYASSLKIVRAFDPVDALNISGRKNAGIVFSNSSSAISFSQENFYNKEIAENLLENLTVGPGQIAFIEKDFTNNHKFAVAICSSKDNFNKPLCDLVDNSIEYSSFSAIPKTIFNNSLINISVARTNTGDSKYTQSLISFSSLFNSEPDWEKGEFCVVVLAKNDEGLYDIFERFICNYNRGFKDSFGRNNFVEDIFLQFSKALYCKIGSISISAEKLETFDKPLIEVFGDEDCFKGIETQGLSSIKFAQDVFNHPENIDVNILITHPLDINGMAEIAENRKDCIAIVAPSDQSIFVGKNSSAIASDLIKKFGSREPFGQKQFTRFGTYSSFYGNMKYQYDKFNDKNRWISIMGDVAGLYAQTDSNRDPWWAPAGSERGIIRNAIKLAFNPNKQNKDDLYLNSINPVVSIPGEGNAVVFGQKTSTAKSSAFDRVNVRRLLIYIEKMIATAARTGLFEFNDAFTRNRLFSIIEPFLRSVKAKRGLSDYLVVIDETNNTEQVIDTNGLVIDIYLKPTKVAEFININAVVVGSGVNFQEIVGNFGG